jgi:hypothetical protein
MSTCIVSIFQYISNKMQRYAVYLYLETILYVSGGTFTHHQERIHLYLQHLVFVTPLLLSAAFVRVVKSRRMRWAGHVARMGEDRGVHRVLVGKPEGKRPLGRPRRRWEDNIKMDLQEVGGRWWGLDGVGSG